MGDWHITPYAVPLFMGGAILLAASALAWRRRSTRGAVVMCLLGVFTAVYVLGYAFELGSSSLSEVRIWLKIEYIGVTTTPVLLLLLAWSYTGDQRVRTPLNILLLFVIPAITLTLAWTNEQHELIWRDMALDRLGDAFITDFTPGTWYWVSAAYAWLMLTAGTVLLVRIFLQVSGLYRRQMRVFLIGVLIPLGTYLVYLVGIFPTHLDLNPYALTLTGIAVAWAMFNYQFLDIVPVAREAVLASMNDAVIVIDAQNRVVDLNSAAQQLFGVDAGRGIGHPAAQVFARWPEIASGNRVAPPQDHAELVIDSQGEERFVDVRTSFLRGRSGRHDGRLVVLRDITDRVRTEKRLAALRTVDQELTSKLDVRYVASIALDAALRISLADAAFIGLAEEAGIRAIHTLGLYPPSMLNQLIPPEMGIAARVLRTREPEMVLDVSVDPDYFAFIPETRAQITLPLVSGEKLIGILNLETAEPERFIPATFETLKLLATRVAVAIDNSYMYEESGKLIKELDAFAHTVAHDLKNPLTLIGGYAEMLLDDYDRLSDVQKKEYLQDLLTGSATAAKIIEALLLMARVRSLKVVEIVPLDMGAIIQEVCARLRPEIERTGAQVVLPDGWPAARGYAPWIEEVWMNYVSNAIKYGGQPPRVQLGSDEAAGGKIRFWVRDNGPGLTPHEQARLFSPFTRLRPVTAEGHGLGLSIVQRIAERLNGEVGVESQAGQGSLFYFTLPAGDGVHGEEAHPLPPAPSRGEGVG